MLSDKEKKTCFVVMGFGAKGYWASDDNKTENNAKRDAQWISLDLEATYESLIKPAVEDAGLQCIRTLDVNTTGLIDEKLYEQLLTADLVIADLSTYNLNAIYELGVRHTLRPYTTIIIAESNFRIPFDLSHSDILTYVHLGTDIGCREADRFVPKLKKRILESVENSRKDSPIYCFLPYLQPPSVAEAPKSSHMPPPPPPSSPPPDNCTPDKESFGDQLRQFRQTRDKGDHKAAISILTKLRESQSAHPYLIQQLALATYNSEQPDKQSALLNAREILSELQPEDMLDMENVELWGNIHRHLWGTLGRAEDLNEAIRTFERGFSIYKHYGFGNQYAELLEKRAYSRFATDAEADIVNAKLVSKEVYDLCKNLLASPRSGDSPRFSDEELSLVKTAQLKALCVLQTRSQHETIANSSSQRLQNEWMQKSCFTHEDINLKHDKEGVGKYLAEPVTDFKADMYIKGELVNCPQFTIPEMRVKRVVKFTDGSNSKFQVELIMPVKLQEGTRFAIREDGRTIGAGVVTKIIK